MYRIFTIYNGTVSVGARIQSFTLSGSGVTLPATIVVGEEGRGRSTGVLPISGAPEGAEIIHFADLGGSRTGKPKLVWKEAAGTDDMIIVLDLTDIGFRGSNFRHGDFAGLVSRHYGEPEEGGFFG